MIRANIQPDSATFGSAFSGLEIRQVGQITLRCLPAQAEIDLAADAAHAGLIVTDDVELAAADMQSLTPFGQALLAVLVWFSLDIYIQGRVMRIESQKVGLEPIAIREENVVGG